MKCEVKKGDAGKEFRLVYGEVYAPNRPDVDGDYMTEEHILNMAHDFVRKGRMGQVDIQHDNRIVPGIQVVESFIARSDDKDFIPGSWVVGVHVNDEAIWSAIKKNEINGFSMEALVMREDREVEMEIPSIVKGLTSKTEDHTHQFFVTYDDQGKFLGGITDDVNGHNHKIVGGTVTEQTNQHRHHFSSVDNLMVI